MPPIPYTAAAGPDLTVRSRLGHADAAQPEIWVGPLAEIFELYDVSIEAEQQTEIITTLSLGGIYRGGRGAECPWTLERVEVLTVTPRQAQVLREAVEIAYADDDAPIYDRPEGSAEVAALYKLLGGLSGVAFPTSGPSTVR